VKRYRIQGSFQQAQTFSFNVSFAVEYLQETYSTIGREEPDDQGSKMAGNRTPN
jgi:hypothetical protein